MRDQKTRYELIEMVKRLQDLYGIAKARGGGSLQWVGSEDIEFYTILGKHFDPRAQFDLPSPTVLEVLFILGRRWGYIGESIVANEAACQLVNVAVRNNDIPTVNLMVYTIDETLFAVFATVLFDKWRKGGCE